MNVLFLGSRIQEMGGFQGNALQDTIYDKIEETLLAQKDPFLITNLQLGVPMWAAEIADQHKIPFIVYVPFTKPESKWFKVTQNIYRDLYKKAINVVQVDNGGFSPQKMKACEHQMIEDADILYTFFPSNNFVTAYAKKQDKKIVDLMPEGDEDDYFIEF